MTLDLVQHLPEWTLTESVFKRISANSNPNLNPNPNCKPNSNPKALKSFRENEMTSFFGQVQIPTIFTSNFV